MDCPVLHGTLHFLGPVDGLLVTSLGHTFQAKLVSCLLHAVMCCRSILGSLKMLLNAMRTGCCSQDLCTVLLYASSTCDPTWMQWQYTRLLTPQ
jgi:hypothetical protein